MSVSVLLNHHFRSFNNGENRVSLFQLQLVGAASGDGALDEILTHSNNNVGHDIAQLDFLNCSTEFVSS